VFVQVMKSTTHPSPGSGDFAALSASTVLFGHQFRDKANHVGFAGEVGASDKPGLGIVTMRERAEAVGGRFEVRALPGRGTRLTVSVPY